jgi:hypothetical protein
VDALRSEAFADFQVQVLPVSEDLELDTVIDQLATAAENAAASGDPNSWAQLLMASLSLFSNDTDGRRLSSAAQATATTEGRMRAQMLASVGQMANNTYGTTADSVQQQAQMTREVCNKPGVLSAAEQDECAGYAENAAALALEVELTPDTAQAVVDTFAGLVSATDNTKGRARGLKSTCSSLARGMLSDSVPGEEANTVDAEGLRLVVQVLSGTPTTTTTTTTDSGPSAVGGGNVVLSDSVASILGEGAGSTFIVTDDNIYDFDTVASSKSRWNLMTRHARFLCSPHLSSVHSSSVFVRTTPPVAATAVCPRRHTLLASERSACDGCYHLTTCVSTGNVCQREIVDRVVKMFD